MMYTGPCYFFCRSTGHSHLLPSRVVENKEDMFVISWAKNTIYRGNKEAKGLQVQ